MIWGLTLVLCLGRMSWGAPLAKKMVDLTHVFDNSTLYFPVQNGFQMTVTENGTTDDNYWLQMEEIFGGVHVGTHMDAPCHFAKGKWPIDQIPLSHLVAPAAVVDITSKAEADRDYEVTIEDLKEWEQKTGRELNEVILLIRSGWSKRWPDRESFTGTAEMDPTKLHFPGIKPETAQWLVDQRRIYGVGTETLSMDYGPSKTFPTHVILYGANIYGLENVGSMDELPLWGATLWVMPMKIGNAGGAPTRIVATMPDIIYDNNYNLERIASCTRTALV